MPPKSQRSAPSRGSSRRTAPVRKGGVNPVALGIAVGLPLLALIGGIIYMVALAPPPQEKVVDENADFKAARKLVAEAQDIYRREYLSASSAAQPRIWKRAKEKLNEAQTALERLYCKYSSDGTLDGDLAADHTYIDQALADISHLRENYLKSGAIDTHD
ncbi:MAG: hypothetical protein HY722_07800 [Planctomycetes bacterium]|nr:hypothetical protein [Planctomycetota bacterium]